VDSSEDVSGNEAKTAQPLRPPEFYRSRNAPSMKCFVIVLIVFLSVIISIASFSKPVVSLVEAGRDDDCYSLEFSCCSRAKDDAIHKKAQSDLSRANYDLGRSQLETESHGNNRTGYKAGGSI